MQRSTIEYRESILVVDDTPKNLKLVFQYLDNAGYKVFIAQTGERALQIAQLASPDLILLDAMMPELDGFAVCEKLKTNAQTRDIPIIFMTALVDTKYKIKGLGLGAVDYVTKPVDVAELSVRIANHLQLKKISSDLTVAVEQKQLLFEISDRIRQSLNLESIFNSAAEEMCAFLACDRLTIVRLTQSDICIESQAFSSRGIYQNLPQLNVRDFVDLNQEKLLKTSTGETKEVNLSQLFVPVLSEDSICANRHHPLWGWLVAEHYSPRNWQEQEKIFLQQLTSQLSIAIQQGLLHQKLKQSYKQLELNNQMLERLAHRDSLTQVYNRRYFQKQLDLEWRRLKRNGAPLSIILCDIDCFKLYNDTYGHQEGDLCLSQVAKVLSTTIKRPADILARYGGEEFVAILPNTDLAGAINVAEAMRFAVKDLGLEHKNSTVDTMVTTSVGVATTVPQISDTPEMLTESADKGLYLAKNRGRDCIAVFRHTKITTQQDIALQWDQRIRQALEKNFFRLYAQPITSLKEDQRQHFEILLRMEDRGEKVFTPDNFMAVAERNSLMSSIDTWVINRLFEQLAERGDSSYWQNYQFSINLSGASLNKGSFLNFLREKLIQFHLPPQLFCFEITEAIAINNLAQIRDFIVSLKQLGCSFALDDFGKGMSSLTYLKNLPVDYLKIDGSFISDLHTDKVSQIMVEAINHLATGIGLKTVAEFVENEQILDALRHLKIDYAQGYHLGRPQKFTEVV